MLIRFCVTAIMAALIFASGFGSRIDAAIITPGNILVMDVNTGNLREYSLSGVFEQSFSVTDDAEAASTEQHRDVAVDVLGNAHIFNGTFTPSLSTIDTATNTQTDRTGPDSGFASAYTTGRGGIAAIGESVFVADAPVGARSDKGIIRFDAGSGFASTRFATDFIPNDLTFGPDGKLYALGTESSGATSTPNLVNVYDPTTLLRLDQLTLPAATSNESLRGLVSDGQGNYFAVVSDGSIIRLDAAGNIVNAFLFSDATSSTHLFDIDIDAMGNLVASGEDGRVYLTNTHFDTQSSFFATTAPLSPSPQLYVSFTTAVVAVPEPTTMVALCGFALIAAYRGGRRVARR
ncbi:hypothetical protein K227x_44110 [Rubripirellula lacrimiformis]|uniref:PEP-CTERM protein-sorting domain-containing protein n=1 Tax=Rubripirellula lacrimiformis TaxID=1930273 RepID=A0A517NFV3_9BACT|nr:hypothetical protein [Rubripirellula lacrimiformis]QDT06004.1 hypothetical protein K227x_44110 [Rubripirellula lacrimiformis]